MDLDVVMQCDGKKMWEKFIWIKKLIFSVSFSILFLFGFVWKVILHKQQFFI
jgi:hypothetical protein